MTISVPFSGEWGLPLRLALSGAGAVCCLTVDVLDDVRMAADEACALLRAQTGAGETVVGHTWRDDSFFYMSLSCGGEPTAENIRLEGSLILDILQTLAAYVWLDGDADGVRRVRFAFALSC